MTDLAHERNGQVLNFSVSADVDEIVSASERISAFCAINGMSARETMRLQMSMDDIAYRREGDSNVLTIRKRI